MVQREIKMDAVIFRNGTPYGPDIKRLNEAFPVPALAEGLVIEHSRLEKVLGYKKGTSRYYGVIDSWINHQRAENSIVIAWELSVGLKVLNPAEILEYAEKRVRQKLTQTGRAIKMFGWVDRDRLDAVGQKRLDHQARVARVLKESVDIARKQLAVELAPIQSLPKPKRE